MPERELTEFQKKLQAKWQEEMQTWDTLGASSTQGITPFTPNVFWQLTEHAKQPIHDLCCNSVGIEACPIEWIQELNPPQFPEYTRRISVIRSHVKAGNIKAFTQDDTIAKNDSVWGYFIAAIYISCADFLALAEKNNWALPPKEPILNTSNGDYSTKLLQLQNEAIEKFWKNYDPTEPDTATKNSVVIDWLKKKDVSANIAKAIATIIRSNDAPKGKPAKS